MSWRHPRRAIDAYLLRGAAACGDERLRVHLEGCAACRAYYDEGVSLLRAARGGLAEAGVHEIERSLRRALGVARPRPSGGGRVPVAWGVGATAALAGVALLAFVLRPPAPVGTVFSTGQALVIDGRPAAVRDEVPSGALVEATGGDSAVLLEGGRGALLREGAQARFVEAGARAMVESGRVRFSVKPGQGAFTVTAGEARVEVRGTIFVVERLQDDETLVAVHRGEVLVFGRSPAVTLKDGQETTVRGGTPTPPRPARAASLSEDRGGDLFDVLKRAWERFLDGLDAAVGK